MPHAAKPLFRLNVLNAKILRTDFPRQQAAQYMTSASMPCETILKPCRR